MKALDLQVYERTDDGDYLDVAASDGRRYVIAQEDVDVYCMTKALTDAELAAEYWSQDSQCRHENWIQTVREIDGDGDYTAAEKAAASVMYEWLSSLHRFATLPDYDEPTP